MTKHRKYPKTSSEIKHSLSESGVLHSIFSTRYNKTKQDNNTYHTYKKGRKRERERWGLTAIYRVSIHKEIVLILWCFEEFVSNSSYSKSLNCQHYCRMSYSSLKSSVLGCCQWGDNKAAPPLPFLPASLSNETATTSKQCTSLQLIQTSLSFTGTFSEMIDTGLVIVFLRLRSPRQLIMGAHDCTPSTQRQKQEDCQ